MTSLGEQETWQVVEAYRKKCGRNTLSAYASPGNRGRFVCRGRDSHPATLITLRSGDEVIVPVQEFDRHYQKVFIDEATYLTGSEADLEGHNAFIRQELTAIQWYIDADRVNAYM